jgi:hypothetical protein
MPVIKIIRPTDQPSGARRLLNELRAQLKDTQFWDLKVMVAFAKLGPLSRLEKEIRTWRNDGRTIEAIFGVDQLGTSSEALEFALEHFSSIRVAYGSGASALNPTFHPKVYLFVGETAAVCYLGSNNLTVGGTETNFEVATIIEMSLPADADLLKELVGFWEDMKDGSIELSRAVLEGLLEDRVVLSEADQRAAKSQLAAGKGDDGKERKGRTVAFPKMRVVPPSPLPKVAGGAPKRTLRRARAQKPLLPSPEGLVIQIVPHHNGEVFLSKIAVDQNPAFFGSPFTGKTSPKKRRNVAYPQRVPDPRVNITVFDGNGKATVRKRDFGLNTVYYTTKSEIRVTMTQDVVQATPARSIMIMTPGDEHSGIDYDLVIYAPGSKEYEQYLAVCNQAMPSGGSAKPRQFGWL